MPYSQIISLMVALVLITGAPSNHHLACSPVELVSLWSLKTLLWWVTVSFLLRRGNVDRQQALFERLESVALLPLGIDFYLLDMKDLLSTIGIMHSSHIIMEFAGMAMYFGYLGILWTANWRAARHKSVVARPLGEELKERLNLILPAIIPYIVLSAGIELGSRMAPAWFRSLFTSRAAPLVSIGIFTLILTFIIPPMLLKMWKCSPLPSGDLKTEILRFLGKIGMQLKNVYIWPLGGGRVCTAAVVGIIPGFRYVLLTPALLKYMQPPEMEAVLSHEAEHVFKKHVLWYVFFLGSYSIVIYRMMDPAWTWLVSQKFFLSLLDLLQDTPESLTSLAAVTPLLILVILYFRYLMGWFMRNFEREADMSVFRTQGHPWHMIAALEKVAILSGGTREKPSWHHYSIAQRVDFLKRAAEHPATLAEHHKKLLIARGVFIIMALVLFLLPDVLPVKTWEKNARTNMAGAYIDQRLTPGQPTVEWYLAISEIMLRHHQYAGALKAYRKALLLDPDNPDIMNNIAWLYATADDPEFRRPQQALLFAMRAASMKPESFILDTLAECFFINGYIKEAAGVGQEALAKAKSNQDYYRRQLLKFQAALRNSREHNSP